MNKGWSSCMDRRLKERLIGATILVVVIVLIVPELLSGPKRPAASPPAAAGASESVRSVTVDLATSKAMPVDDQAASGASTATAPTEGGGAAVAPPAASAGAPGTVRPAPPSIATLQAQQPAPGTLENEVSPPTSAQESARVGASRGGAAADNSHQRWTVQIGSFASRENAEKLMRRVKAHEAAYVSPLGKGPAARYRVRIGPFLDRAAAEKAMARLRREGQSASLVPP